MAFKPIIEPLADQELSRLRVFDQRIITAAIEKHLRDEPLTPTRRRKPLLGVKPEFEHASSLWELRVGDYRVFYDVDIDATEVHIRAIRRKAPRQRTEEIL